MNARRRAGAHAQPPAHHAARILYGLAPRLELGEGALGVLEQDLARAGGGGALAHALHERQPHLLLELTDVQAHGGLAQVQVLGGAREAAAPHHFLQGADVREVQVEERRRHGPYRV